jgi:hypothetical protein
VGSIPTFGTNRTQAQPSSTAGGLFFYLEKKELKAMLRDPSLSLRMTKKVQDGEEVAG